MVDAINELFRSLRGRFQGDLLRPESRGYEDAQTIWNGMVAKRPGLIARCTDVADIQAAVGAASKYKILTAVRCGGLSSSASLTEAVS